MKRIDITSGTYYEVIDKLDLRPSIKNIIHDELFHYNIGHVSELCRKTEDELIALQILPFYVIDPIKQRLEEVGLKLGMTERELIDYMDADYLEEKAKAQAKSESGQDKEENAEKDAEEESDSKSTRGKGPVQTLVISHEEGAIEKRVIKMIDFAFEIVFPILTLVMSFYAGWYLSKEYNIDHMHRDADCIKAYEPPTYQHRDTYEEDFAAFKEALREEEAARASKVK